MKWKNGEKPRLKFHIVFILSKEITLADEYVALKKSLNNYFPYFDAPCVGAGRKLFGTINPQVKFLDE